MITRTGWPNWVISTCSVCSTVNSDACDEHEQHHQNGDQRRSRTRLIVAAPRLAWDGPGERGGRWRAAWRRLGRGGTACARQTLSGRNGTRPFSLSSTTSDRRVRQDVLHRLEIHAPQRHVLRRLVGRQHRQEALRLPGRLGDRGLPARPVPSATMPRRVAAGARHDVVAIGLGLVAQAFGVGVGALHVDGSFRSPRPADRPSATAPG